LAINYYQDEKSKLEQKKVLYIYKKHRKADRPATGCSNLLRCYRKVKYSNR